VDDLPILVAIRNTENFAERLAVGKFDGCIIEFAAHDKVKPGILSARGLRVNVVTGGVRQTQCGSASDWPPSSRQPLIALEIHESM
jgi:hypothetical protein